MNIVLDNYTPLISYLSPASIPQIVAHIQDYLLKHPILSVETVAEIIVQSLQEHPELLNGEAIPISADSEQSIKAYIDALPFLDTYTKAEINALLLGKQDTLTFDQAPTPGSSNPVTSSGIIAALSALQTALETQIGLKADSSSTYTKTQVDTLLEDKADADDVYSKNTMDAKLLEINTDIDNLEDALSDQSQQIAEKVDIPVIVSVTVDANGASMSVTDQAKLTADMVMCWYTGDRLKLTSNLSITPGAGTATVTGTASSSTTFTIAFIHSANEVGIASVIKDQINTLNYIVNENNVAHITAGILTVPKQSSIREIVNYIITNIIDTKNRYVTFDIMFNDSGTYHMTGYLYSNKMYGAGLLIKYVGDLMFWNMLQGNITVYNITKSAI